MRRFIFPGDVAWIVAKRGDVEYVDGEPGLTDYRSSLVGESTVGKCVSLFTDEDLAQRFIDAHGDKECAVASLICPVELLAYLRTQQHEGIASVALDPAYGRPFPATPIQEAIRDVQEESAQENEHQGNDGSHGI